MHHLSKGQSDEERTIGMRKLELDWKRSKARRKTGQRDEERTQGTLKDKKDGVKECMRKGQRDEDRAKR